MKVKTINFGQIEQKCLDIFKKYKDKDIDLILGVNSGGIIPAFMVKLYFDVSNRKVSYKNIRPNKLLEKDLGIYKNILVIDDILDTGKTRAMFYINSVDLQLSSNIFFETLYKAKKNEWIIFPWESMQDSINSRQTKF